MKASGPATTTRAERSERRALCRLPTRVTAHLSLVLAGLLELRRAGRIRLVLSRAPVRVEPVDFRNERRRASERGAQKVEKRVEEDSEIL